MGRKSESVLLCLDNLLAGAYHIQINVELLLYTRMWVCSVGVVIGYGDGCYSNKE